VKEDLLKIINFYGYRNQLRKLNEECYELIEAIIDYMDDGSRLCTKKDIEEEFADVMVLLSQIKFYYELDDERIKKIMEEKIARQLERMKNE
jgi:NTP pyrophosphatase (non-canonical NTP hydrolase)